MEVQREPAKRERGRCATKPFNLLYIEMGGDGDTSGGSSIRPHPFTFRSFSSFCPEDVRPARRHWENNQRDRRGELSSGAFSHVTRKHLGAWTMTTVMTTVMMTVRSWKETAPQKNTPGEDESKIYIKM